MEHLETFGPLEKDTFIKNIFIGLTRSAYAEPHLCNW